jgi:hypothetical protein
MAELLTDSGRWTVSTRTNGEVLAVRVGEGALQMGFLGRPRGLQASEIQSWLSELIGMSAAAEAPMVGPGAEPSAPIPRSLHQALTGLLFLQAEVWGDPADRVPLALVVAESGGRVALGWSGSGRVTVVRSGQPAEPAWVIVRDDEGREARALVCDGDGPLSVRAFWSAPGSGAEPLEGELVAEWPGRRQAMDGPGEQPEADRAAARDEHPMESGAEVASGVETPPVEPSAGSEPSRTQEADESVAAPRTAARPRPFWHFRGWMDRLTGSTAKEKGTTTEAPAGSPSVAEEPLAPQPPCELEPIAHDVPGVPDLLPEASGVEEAEPGLPVAELIQEPLPAPEPPAVEDAEPGLPVAELIHKEAAAVAEPVAQAPAFEPSVTGPSAPPQSDPLLAEVLQEFAGGGPVEPNREPIVESVAPAVSESPAVASPRLPARRLEWPEEEEPRRLSRLRWRPWWIAAAVVLGLFALGWLLGHVDAPAAGRTIGRMFMTIGLGPARYEVAVTSRPAGAWIAVDGVEQLRRTPATLALEPGSHEVTLSFSPEGGSSHPVNGKRGERVSLDVALWGGLRIEAPAGGVPLTVMVDGQPQGYAPLVLDRLQPGIHRLQFSGPGVAPWEQTVEVHVNRTAEVIAQPVVSPPTGVLEVRARLSDETGSEPLAGAAVRVDGQARGVTPLRLELPRGPHSVRVSYRGEDSPVQVIELPGGNQRYATLDIGLSLDQPRLAAALPGRVTLGSPTVLSATLERAREGDVREMWLHVRTPEGAWRRYPMSVMKAPGGLAGAVPFPTDLFDRGGRTAWYVSALAPTGDEYFTEIQSAQAAAK